MVTQMLVRLLSDEELRFNIDVEDLRKAICRRFNRSPSYLVNLFFVDLVRLAPVLDSSVGEHDIETTEFLDDLFEELDQMLPIGNIGLDDEGANAQRPTFLGHLLRWLGRREVIDHDISTVLGQAYNTCSTDASARASD